ncbi:hypothetical protein [Providencia alcalifaciens]|uniref:hypothetical protein n=1 Tax=Providencia alcalifaciens TaxID=126385 RepID=UPI002B058D34|nr:hypothetical protein [Providencia alcalifaciens]
MRQLFIFIASLFPLSVYAETTFTPTEPQSVTFDELTSILKRHEVRFTVNYTLPKKATGHVITSCWSGFDEMKNAVNSVGLGPNQRTYSDGMLNLRGSNPMSFIGTNGSINGVAYLDAASGFENKTWTFYCTAVNSAAMNGNDEYFRPSTITYTEINVRASSAFPHISAPAVIDLKTCSPGDNLKAAIPLTVGFVGYMGQSKKMDLTVRSHDLPDDFDIVLDNQSILNKLPQVIQMPAGQKEKQIETHLQGKCPSQAGEYIWNAEYITTIQ